MTKRDLLRLEAELIDALVEAGAGEHAVTVVARVMSDQHCALNAREEGYE